MKRSIPKPNGDIRSIHEGHVVRLQLEGVDMPDGRTVDFEVVRHAPATAILALDDRDRAILVYQFRHAIGQEIWEIPAGIMEEGENPLDCARRELQEETGFVAEQWKSLGSMLPAPGFCDEVIYLYLARGLSLGAQNLDDNEFLQPHAIPLEEVHEMALCGDITDGKSLAALYRAKALMAL